MKRTINNQATLNVPSGLGFVSAVIIYKKGKPKFKGRKEGGMEGRMVGR